MPTYDYRCSKCNHEWELFQSIKAEPEKKCPECGRKTAKRVIGSGAGIIFRGSGFYQTDYRSEGYKKAAAADKQSSGGGSSSESKSESKPSSESKAKSAD
ncbi:MAG: zinc ribbon domain-containing protein [Planctomycetaceae bacterium]